jgi:carbamoyl-phosphate synthase large subunit
MRVLIAGIAGASLGTELFKCLALAGVYELHGCDVSGFAYGHYMSGFKTTHVVRRDHYIEDLLRICSQRRIQALVPGGEEPLQLICDAADRFREAGVALAVNSSAVVGTCTDKLLTFARLRELGLPTPVTVAVRHAADVRSVPMPCVVKPARGSGGSMFVFLAGDQEQAWLYARYLRNHGLEPLAQEYLDHADGEFSLGVLSLPTKGVVSVIAMRRRFDAKLSIQLRSTTGIISSPYGQGLIDEFPEIGAAGRTIAEALRSEGPINVQGRLRKGVFVPFEVNPRFSGSEYLRALAGANHPHILLRYLESGAVERPQALKRGYYFRSLSETFVDAKDIRS